MKETFFATDIHSPNWAAFVEECKGFSDAITLFNKLQNNPAKDLELKLHVLEKDIKNQNIETIKRFAKKYGETFIKNPNIPDIPSKEIACFARYIIVPFLYKVGLTKEASELNQKTFAYLLPLVNEKISGKIHSLFFDNLDKDFARLKETFSPSPEQNIRFYCRIKSNQSIWKKYVANNYSTDEFSNFDYLKFAQVVDDFVALRWCVSVKQENHENRYDATIRGVREIPKAGLYHLRNQHLVQQSGFSSEPVIKLLYIFDNIPVEVQILGGQIELYMCAKGYTNYKTEIDHFPSAISMTEQDWHARLGTSIFLQEQERYDAFYQLMLQEISDDQNIQYDSIHTYSPEKMPNLDENRLFDLQNHQVSKTPNIDVIPIETLVTETSHKHSNHFVKTLPK